MKEIELTQGKVAFVDDEDFDFINRWKWYLGKRKHLSYGVRNYRPRGNSGPHMLLLMHRIILERHEIDLNGLEIDHIDGNGLNNLKSNLRLATRSENSRNSKKKPSSSPYKGVIFVPSRDRWLAQINVNNKHIHCGYHLTQDDAARAYNRAAVKYFGEFARINVGVGQPEQDSEIYTKRFPRKRRNATSKYRGVSFHKSTQNWAAQIQIRGKTIWGGCYPTEELAALAYNDLVLLYVGNEDLTRLNHL